MVVMDLFARSLPGGFMSLVVVMMLQTKLPWLLLSLEILLGWGLGLQGTFTLMELQIRRVALKDITRRVRPLPLIDGISARNIDVSFLQLLGFNCVVQALYLSKSITTDRVYNTMTGVHARFT